MERASHNVAIDSKKNFEKKDQKEFPEAKT
jgi:hypothetical protein